MKENKTQKDFSIVKSEIEKHLGVSIGEPESLGGGFNNKIFKVGSENGKSYLLKWYFKDDRNRLNREFSAFEYLRSLGETRLPMPYFKDDDKGYAVYSFETGRVKPGKELIKRDLDDFLSFIFKLQDIKPIEVKQDFPNAVLSTRSAEQFSSVILGKVRKFEELIKTPNTSPDIVNFSERTRVLERINGKMENLKRVGGNSFSEEIDYSLMRLSPVDFGPHNALFKENGEVCFIDFEYFGWDDPSKIVANFVTHEGSWGISNENVRYFINKYRGGSKLPKDIVDRVKIFVPLQALNWISILLWSFTPQKLESRKFADPNFNESKYVEYLTSRIKKRLDQLDVLTIK